MPATTGTFGDMPLVVLSHDPEVSEFRIFFPPADADKTKRVWTDLQEELRGLSSRMKGLSQKEVSTTCKSIALS